MSDNWSVTVERDGETIVTISSNSIAAGEVVTLGCGTLSGRALDPLDADAVIAATLRLLAFVGERGRHADA